MKIVLVGMMGSGKSATARSVARLLGWQVVDTDQLIRTRAGMTIPELFARDGEAGFRRHEVAAVHDALVAPGDAVVALGGGAITSAEVRTELSAELTGGLAVAYLRTSAAEILGRVGVGAGRPMLQPDPAAAVARLLAQRSHLYEAAATSVVDTDGHSIDEVAAAVVAAVGESVVRRRP